VFKRNANRVLFKPHQEIDDILKRSNRFRALDRIGLLELAKDLARLTVERMDGTCLLAVVPTPGDMKPGSIKHLEAALAAHVSIDEARGLTAVFVGINELRQADAHLPASNLNDSLSLAGITDTGNSISEASQMLYTLVDSLFRIADAINKSNEVA